jgi:hypothetical protein
VSLPRRDSLVEMKVDQKGAMTVQANAVRVLHTTESTGRRRQTLTLERERASHTMTRERASIVAHSVTSVGALHATADLSKGELSRTGMMSDNQVRLQINQNLILQMFAHNALEPQQTPAHLCR